MWFSMGWFLDREVFHENLSHRPGHHNRFPGDLLGHDDATDMVRADWGKDAPFPAFTQPDEYLRHAFPDRQPTDKAPAK